MPCENDLFYIRYYFPLLTGGEGGAAAASQVAAFVPNPRINCVLAHKQNTVYMYGGLYEPGDKQVNLIGSVTDTTTRHFLTEITTIAQTNYSFINLVIVCILFNMPFC